MKIAIIGSGISGLTAAYLLHREHDITMYEAANYIGGHVNTIDVEESNKLLSVDTGFIVFNNWTYPNFEKILSDINIEVQDSEMSFSAHCEKTGYEWSGSGLRSLIFNKNNWWRHYSYQIFLDVVRFNKISKKYLTSLDANLSLGTFLKQHRFSQAFINYYILPMGAAIWSSETKQINEFPARSFLNFFNNHGLLNLKYRPQWKTIKGGSKNYVKELINPFIKKIHINTPVMRVKRVAQRIEVFAKNRKPEYFDHVFFACHSYQAARLLDDATYQEKSVLNSIRYQPNTAILHTDESLMPKSKIAWSSWNYLLPKQPSENVKVTYYMNRLQKLSAKKNYFVSLNLEGRINPKKVIKIVEYMHPVFDQPAIDAQYQQTIINGTKNSWYCGAYWRNGFHEDGVWSAIQSVEQFNSQVRNEELYLQRAS